MDIGLEAAGFENRLCVEVDHDARASLRLNRPHWTLATPGDVHAHVRRPADLLELANVCAGDVELLAGGPPCQPFSKSGFWSRGESLRLNDPRATTLRAYLRIVRIFLPRVILLENVRGFTFAGKDEGLRLVEEGLARINRLEGTRYAVSVLFLNAADFGVPQHRERVFLVASRCGSMFAAPSATHGESKSLSPFSTAWDSIGDLDVEGWPAELRVTGKWARLLPTIPEGKNYLWHTPGGGGEPFFGWRTRYWSFLLKLAKARPSWTLQAEPGPATGPFHWRSRLLSVRELCRLQTFPDDYEIVGTRRSAHRQLGNAVPCAMAEVLGWEIRRQILGDALSSKLSSLIPRHHSECPPPARVGRVPKDYQSLRGEHRPHPGTGGGPSAKKRTGSTDHPRAA